jgi:hypothetical protein
MGIRHRVSSKEAMVEWGSQASFLPPNCVLDPPRNSHYLHVFFPELQGPAHSRSVAQDCYSYFEPHTLVKMGRAGVPQEGDEEPVLAWSGTVAVDRQPEGED